MNDPEDGEGRKSTRFQKGRSGNPRGRPKGRHKGIPHEQLLGQMVTIRESGVEKQVTAAEAFLLFMLKKGLQGDGPANRALSDALEQFRANRPFDLDDAIDAMIVRFVSPGSVNWALEPLRMAVKLDRLRDTARMALEPWLVEAALARLGARRLTLAEQQGVVRATRTPAKVRWPDWWEAFGADDEPESRG